MLQIGFLGKLKWFASAVKATKAFKALQFIGTIATLAVGVKGFLQARQMLAKGQDIMANKTAAGGKIPLIYGLRRVGAQIVYMDTKNNRSKDLFVVYALAVGECEEILGETIEIDGNSILDPNIYKAGGYVGSDKIASGSGSLCTASQVGDVTYSNAGTLGTDPTLRYSFVFNLHHGATSQTADPMLTASIPEAWTSSHKLNGICYIAAAFDYDKKGMYKGVPQITVQVKGKKVYDPRSDTTAWSSNAALCFLDYIQNDEYGKGLATADINMSTFEDAADACDVLQNQPYYGSSYQNVTWSGESGTKKICISNFDDAFQNKIDEVISIKDSLDTVIKSQETINEFKTNEFYDQTRDNCLILDTALTSDYTNEAGSIYAQVKRFTCNGYVDTNKNVMDNAKELLANMRGIFTYINGKYELQIEDTGSSTFSITDNHIISDAGISIDYGNKDKKANKVIVEFFNANKKYELDTVTEFHDATPNYYSDDGEILEIKAEFPYVTDPYIASNMAKAILGRSRNQTAIQFLGTPEMYKLNVGDIVDITYDGLDLSSTNNNNVFRIEALELQSNGLVSVSAIQYLDIYTWEVPTQEATADPTTPPTVGAIHPPDATSIVFTDTDASPIGRPTLTWTEPTDFPVRQYRVNVVDSSDVNVFSKIVDTPSVDLSYLAPASNYEAQITSFNGVGLESEAVTKTFTISDEPTRTEDIQDLAVTNAKINDLSADKIDTGVLNVGTESGMAVRQAKTGYTDTTTGFWLGNDSGTPKFNIGTSTDYFKFDGSSVDIAGDLTATNLTIEADATITGTLDASVITLDGQDLSTLIAYGSVSGQTGNFFKVTSQFDLEGRFYWDANNNTSYFDLGTGGIDNVSLYFKTEAPIVFQDGAAALGTFELNFGDDDYVNYYNDYISLVADWTNAQQGTGDVTKFIIKGRSSDLTSAPKQNIASFEFSSADGFGQAKTVFNGLIETPTAVIEDYITIEQNTAPSTTTDKLYNVSGDLYWNGSELGVGAITSVTNMADNRVITASGSNSLNGEANLTFNGSTLTVTGDQIVTGDLTVQGTTTTIDTTNLDVKDKNITLNYGTGDTSANANGAGITIQDAVSATEDATILWDTTSDDFNFSHAVFVSGNISTNASLSGQSILVSSSGYGTVELGGVSGARIDLKKPNTDDYDLRISTEGTGGIIDTASGDVTIKRVGSTKLATTSDGIDVTGTVTSDGLTVDGDADINGTLEVGTSTSGVFNLKRPSTNYIRANETGGTIAMGVRENIRLFTGQASGEFLTNERLRIANNGDISFYEDTGTTAKLFWDASAESLGIGETAPSDLLHIKKNQNAGTQIQIENQNTGDSSYAGLNLNGQGNNLTIKNWGDGTSKANATEFISTASGSHFIFSTESTERVRIDSSGNLGIGTTSPNASLSIAKQTTALSGTGNNYGLHLYPTSSGVVYVDAITGSTGNTDLRLRSYNNGTYNQLIGSSSGGTVTTFQTGGSERMRIDSSGRVGIGATPANSNLDITRSNALVASLNRSSGTGAVIDFRYNNTAKGNIGTNDITASDIYIATGDGSSSTSGVGLRFLSYLTTQNIYPSRSDGTVVDDVISLGASGGAFKNLYLSGVINAGSGTHTLGDGTGSSQLVLLAGTTGNSTLDFGDSADGNIGRIEYTHSSDAMTFRTNNLERMRIDSSGRVGIGNSSPATGLDVTTTNYTYSGTNYDIYGIIGTTNGGVRLGGDSSNGDSIIGTTGANDMQFVTYNGSAWGSRMTLTNTGNVGIGTSSPSRQVVIYNTSNSELELYSGTTSSGFIYFRDSGDSNVGALQYNHNGNYMAFRVNDAERMRIESTGLIRAVTSITSDPTNTNAYFYNKSGVGSTLSGYQFSVRTGATPSESYRVDNNGNLLVGKTSTNFAVAGTQLAYDGAIVATRSANPIVTLNRLSTDGEIQRFFKDGTQVGSIGNTGSAMYVGSPSGSDAFLLFTNNRVQPCTSTGANRDNIIDLGIGNARFDDIYATNGTINTSDINEKQDIEDLSEAETRVAVAAKGLLKKYRWKSAVADKGDDARIHFGIIAQDLQNAFANEGLDAGDYGMFISSTWTDEETGEEKTRLGVRYNELLAFIIAAI